MPGTGHKRTGQRLLTVGTDCAVGKKYTALAIEKEMRARGVDADFRATGQTGIFISGRGIAVDSVVADFISGAAEWLSPAAAPDHWDVIEGQGSLFHPAYAGVTLGLVHGSQPDAMVLCHDLARTGIADYEGYAIPSYEACFETYLAAARLTNPRARFAGISLNTSQLDEEAAERAIAEVANASRCPAATRSATASRRSSTASSRALMPRSSPIADVSSLVRFSPGLILAAANTGSGVRRSWSVTNHGRGTSWNARTALAGGRSPRSSYPGRAWPIPPAWNDSVPRSRPFRKYRRPRSRIKALATRAPMYRSADRLRQPDERLLAAGTAVRLNQ